MNKNKIRYFLMECIHDITVYATLLSIIGSFLVCSSIENFRLNGYLIWVISNVIWSMYFLETKQYNPMILFIIYLITSICGVINNV